MAEAAMVTSRPVTSGHKNPLHFGLPLRLKKTREAAGLTAVHVAKIAKVSNQTIHDIEDGAKGKAPRVDTIEAIARALGVEACWLAFGVQGRKRFRLRVPGGAPPDGQPHCGQQQGQGGDLPARLAAVRQARGLSRLALGRLSKTSDTTVRQIETGRSVPGVDVVERLAGALDVAACWLAYGQGEAPSLGGAATGKAGGG